MKIVPIAAQAPPMLVDPQTSETDDGDSDDEFEIWGARFRPAGRSKPSCLPMWSATVNSRKL